MSEKDLLEKDIKDLKDAYKKIREALNNLKDVNDFDDEQYRQLHFIAEDINDLRIDKEIELERLEEIA